MQFYNFLKGFLNNNKKIRGISAPGFPRLSCSLSALAVLLVNDRLQPLVGGILAGYLHRQMREPAVGRGSVPVLHSGRDSDHIARVEELRRLAPFLIPAAAVNAD